MKKLDVYDPALCCSTGVCGPKTDPALVTFAADLQWLAGQGVAVRRYNLAREPEAFSANSSVLKEMEAGLERLPVIAIDGQIVSTGVYPSREQLAQKLGLEADAKPQARRSCCSSGSGCC